MKGLHLGFLMVLLCHIALALGFKYSRGSLDQSSYNDERNLMNYLQDVKRTDWRKALCGKWDDWCLPDSNKPGLTCCENYTCKCNLWNTNCRCKSKLFSGKRTGTVRWKDVKQFLRRDRTGIHKLSPNDGDDNYGYDGSDETDWLDSLKRKCASIGDTCELWSNKALLQCCDDEKLACKCNLWGQNCRCVARMWGRRRR